jgi:hypothetical protein
MGANWRRSVGQGIAGLAANQHRDETILATNG